MQASAADSGETRATDAWTESIELEWDSAIRRGKMGGFP